MKRQWKSGQRTSGSSTEERWRLIFKRATVTGEMAAAPVAMDETPLPAAAAEAPIPADRPAQRRRHHHRKKRITEEGAPLAPAVVYKLTAERETLSDVPTAHARVNNAAIIVISPTSTRKVETLTASRSRPDTSPADECDLARAS